MRLSLTLVEHSNNSMGRYFPLERYRVFDSGRAEMMERRFRRRHIAFRLLSAWLVTEVESLGAPACKPLILNGLEPKIIFTTGR
jgi:hypothetical protein